MQKQSSIPSQKMGLWCTWIFAALTVIGWLGIAHFYAPFPADAGMDATKAWFTEEHRMDTIAGCTIFYIAAGLLTPGSIQFGIGIDVDPADVEIDRHRVGDLDIGTQLGGQPE